MSLDAPHPVPFRPLGAAPTAPEANRELASLPAPRCLHEFLARSQHDHFGFFETPGDSLREAQDRLVLRGARLLQRNSLVVDVGCGLGGAVNLLAAQGHRVIGIDPCAASIAYARTRASSPRAQFVACDLTEFTRRARGARFDALLLTEVLAHFPDVGAVLNECRALLRPGGLLLVHEVVQHPSLVPRPGGFHARGALSMAADAAGFDVLEARDLTTRTSPTVARLGRALGEKRQELLGAFAPERAAIARELDEWLARLRALELGFARAELSYQATLLRCSARLGTDSVVMRVPARPVPAPLRPPEPQV